MALQPASLTGPGVSSATLNSFFVVGGVVVGAVVVVVVESEEDPLQPAKTVAASTEKSTALAFIAKTVPVSLAVSPEGLSG